LREWLGDLWHYPFLADAWGTAAEWFSGAASLAAVVVALWQSVVIRNQAIKDAEDAAEQFQAEIDAANQRTIKEVQAAELRSRTELAAADARHQAEMQQQQALAKIQRVAITEQEFKLALIRVSKAASAYSHELATLLAETERILKLATSNVRAEAIKPLAKKRNLAAHDLTLEVAGAHMLTNDQRMHRSMDPIITAGMAGTVAADAYEATVISGRMPSTDDVYSAMAALSDAVGDARKLAAEVLVTGWS
jgi:hypothetical protein